ncbi:hypothetical protein HOD20_01775 [archaeon]|jgi:hypothetical protein|nr:hypothetical protein [archaeon]MBT4351234.1 hypothetical protein [archaeon]MBT4647654.1 hypothetical protein [archaeon]MBT6822231.1 hypothetical protein [archaeon]
MVKRIISTKKYFLALVITIIIFGLAIIFGMIMDNKRIIWLENNLDNIKQDYIYMKGKISLSENNLYCSELMKITRQSEQKLVAISKNLAYFKNIADMKINFYSEFEADFYKTILDTYFISSEIETLCKKNIVQILYLYSDNCLNCYKQKIVFEYISKKFENNIQLYLVNSERINDELLKNHKIPANINIKSLIIIDDEKIGEFASLDEIQKLICGKINDEKIC